MTVGYLGSSVVCKVVATTADALKLEIPGCIDRHWAERRHCAKVDRG